ncbi:MAG: hypothetical protein WC289_03470 [Patescibacteria group bacterium]|jgi:hypothetical protein
MIAPQERIGNGHVHMVRYSADQEIRETWVRGGAYVSDICVGLYRPHDGRLFIPFWENVLMHEARKQRVVTRFSRDLLIHQVFATVYEALRYTYHVLDIWYGITFVDGEKGRLLLAKDALQELNLVAIRLRKGNAAELAHTFRERAGFIIRQIGETPTNELKRRAHDHTVSLQSVLDSMGRPNSGAKRAVTVAAGSGLDKRLIDVRCIEPKILARRQTLKTIVEEMEVYLNGVYNFLTLLMSDHKLEQSLTRDSDLRTAIDEQIGFYRWQLQRFDILPFRTTSAHMFAEFGNARTMLTRGQYGDALAQLRVSWNSLKLRKIRTEVEALILQLTFMLSAKADTLDRDVCVSMSRKIGELTHQAESVDESHFKTPVAEDAIACFTTARVLLQDSTADSGKKTKESLKLAASFL